MEKCGEKHPFPCKKRTRRTKVYNNFEYQTIRTGILSKITFEERIMICKVKSKRKKLIVYQPVIFYIRFLQGKGYEVYRTYH